MPLGEGYKDFDDCVRKNSDKEDPKAYCGKIQAAVEDDMTDFQVRTRITHTAQLDAFEETEDGRMFANIRIIRAGMSKNRRNYPASVVQEAVKTGFWNGTLMFLKHDKKRIEPGDRDFGEMVSAIESTTWDAQEKAANGRVEFFDRPFFEKARRAKDYIGVSINALVRGTRRLVDGEVQEDVSSFAKSRSVDWVFNPAAGGAILAFEDEDEDMGLDWSKVTAEDLKRNNAAVYEAIRQEALESKGPDDDPEDEGDGARPDISKIVQEAIKEEREKEEQRRKKRASARELVANAFDNSGLPTTTKKRVMASFEDVEEFDEAAVNEAIKEAKEELKAAGAGPHITDMGPTSGGGTKGGEEQQERVLVAHESMRTSFLGKRGANAKKSDDSEEETK